MHPNAADDPPLLLSASEAARLLGVSERKFHQLRHDPNFVPARVLGARCVRWYRPSLVAYAESLPNATVLPEPAHLAARRR